MQMQSLHPVLVCSRQWVLVWRPSCACAPSPLRRPQCRMSVASEHVALVKVAEIAADDMRQVHCSIRGPYHNVNLSLLYTVILPDVKASIFCQLVINSLPQATWDLCNSFTVCANLVWERDELCSSPAAEHSSPVATTFNTCFSLGPNSVISFISYRARSNSQACVEGGGSWARMLALLNQQQYETYKTWFCSYRLLFWSAAQSGTFSSVALGSCKLTLQINK